EDALRAQASRLAEFVADRPALDPEDVGFTLGVARASLGRRAVVVAGSRDELLAGLGAVAGGGVSSAVLRGVVGAARPGVAFLFSGQGSQRLGMGRELYDAFPVFAEAFDAVCTELDGLLGRSLREVVWAAEGTAEAALLDQTVFTQAALFAVETALFRLVASFGVVPDFVVGHSIGELAAAHVSGLLGLADACALVAARGRLMQDARSGGAMVAVEAGEAEVRESLAAFAGRVDLAAVNGPRAVVVSGDQDAVLEVAAAWAARGVRTRRLTVSHAFHSPHMEGFLEEFERTVAGLEFGEPVIPLVSTLTGAPAGTGELADPAYWPRQVRGTVRFADAVETLHGLGVGSFLELGPDGVLLAMAEQTLAASGAEGVLAPALRRGQGEARSLLAMLATAHVSGTGVDWSVLFPAARLVDLPSYAFQRTRYWLEAPAGGTGASALGLQDSRHPLLGAITGLADGGVLFSGRLSRHTHPWLTDH
ncbi:acyltransferase domain-containing protein, partial [Kitasatospora sp. NPDC058162]|uniref:acyltransferase domain-containing protein n=1 Tax=Kitasatospora sp. NPDC058162 TaxID=3346362 RepID=UPI0036D96E06